MTTFTVKKIELELLMEKIKILKEKLLKIGNRSLSLEEEDFNNIVDEVDYLIAGLYTMINPKEKELKFDRKMPDKSFVLYANEMSNSLDKDIEELLHA